MAEIVIAVLSKVAECLVKPAIVEGKYFLCANNVVEDFKKEKDELTSERDRLQRRVQRATARAEEIEEPVENWQNGVDNLLAEAAALEQEMTANNSCLQGQFPTWRRYRLCKKMARKIEEMGKFKDKSNNFQPFSHPAPLPGIQYESSENFIQFEATELAYNQLLEALQDESVCKIGVYGMGGSGKTTLVTQVGKKAEELNLFEKVISITVSQTPNIKEIQGKMADMLSVRLKEESEDGRAQRLWMCLKKKKRVLIIVDDLWRVFILSKIGIRLENDYTGIWKILVTTRSREVCDMMNCQKRIHLGLLTKDESWTLFKKRANIDDGFSKSLADVPQKLCDECKGLPIAIVTVGSALKGKSKAEWEVALHSLKHPEENDDQVEGGVGDTFNAIKLSYDYLKNKEAELLFLMCSLFPEDHEIEIKYLVLYAIGLRQRGTSSLEYERNRVETGLNKLLDCCLLMQDGIRKEYVKMHDLVRDVALWIAKRSEDHKMLVNLDKPLGTMAKDPDVNISDFYAVSSWYKEDQICLQWDAPKLEIVLLNTIFSGSMDLSQEKLEGKERLRIFSLINRYYSIPPSLSLPQSIKLTNLQTLRLEGWSLGDISFIGCLERLEVLDLGRCRFSKVPDEIGKLKRLKLLDLSYCHIEEHSNGAIGKCVQLEELYFTCYKSKDLFIQSIGDIVTLPNLNRFVISTHFSTHMDLIKGARRLLEIGSVDNILKIGESNKNLLQKVEILKLRDIGGGCKNIIPDMNGVVGGMNDLTYLYLEGMEDLECIFDHTASASQHELVALLPKPVTLMLSNMKNLTELCRGPPQQVLHLFENLEELSLMNCPQLRSIFPSECNLGSLKILEVYNCNMLGEALFSISSAQSLTQLEALHIYRCDGLKHIIASGRECGTCNTSNRSSPSTSHSIIMPKLKKVHLQSCSKLKFMFPICCVEGLAQLQRINIWEAPELEYVFGECDDKDHSSHQYQNQVIMLPPLDHLFLNSLKSLIGICPENYNVKWPSVRELTVSYCPQLTTSRIAMMIGSEQRHHHLNQDQQMHSPSKLQQLQLSGLPQLKLISCMGPTPTQILSLHCLQRLNVHKCQNLKSLFSIVAHRSLPELRTLEISDCHELEQIISEDEEADEHLSNAQVFFPKLMDIIVEDCNKLKSLFSVAMVRMLPQLSSLCIEESTQLEAVFRHGRGDDTVSGMEIVLPNLTNVQLINLPNFVDICQGFELQAVKLQRLDTAECPKIAPSLTEIELKLAEADLDSGLMRKKALPMRLRRLESLDQVLHGFTTKKRGFNIS